MIRELYIRYKRKMILVNIINILVSAWLVGYLGRYFTEYRFGQDFRDNFFLDIGYCFARCIPGFIILLLVIMGVEAYLCRSKLRVKPIEKDTYEKAEDNSRGSAQFATDEEIAEHYDVGPVEQERGLIIGWDGEKNVYAQKDKSSIIGTNNHILLIGKSGSGKSFTFLANAVYQSIRSGASMFITDPSGELYESTSETARKNGYDVKILNIRDASEFSTSDTFNPLHEIKGNYSKAVSIARTIIINYAPAIDIWAKFAQSLLVSLILYVDGRARENMRIRWAKDNKECGIDTPLDDEALKECSLGSIKELLEEGIDKLKETLNTIRTSDPGYGSAQEFLHAESLQQVPAFKNLNDTLNFFNDINIKKMTYYNDIDIRKTGSEKCAYYLCINATDRSYDFLSALFYANAFAELQNEAERQPDRSLKNKVRFILEEFPSTGFIPTMEGVVQNYRKYNIDIILCTQTVMQLEEKGYSKSMLDAFDTVLFLGTNSPDNAEYLRQRLGTTTTISRSRSESINRILNSGGLSYSESVSEAERDLMTLQEIMTELNRGVENSLKEIVITYRCAPFICKTYPRTFNPLEAEREDVKVQDHIPVEHGNKVQNAPSGIKTTPQNVRPRQRRTAVLGNGINSI